jgi:C-terminal processing protease CtpA/Prc
MFSYLPEDGYADNVNYIRLSTNFPYYHRNIFGLYPKYRITYIDSAGFERAATIPYYYPSKDTTAKAKKIEKLPRPKKLTKKQRRENIRSFAIDSTGKFGLMKLNSFSKGHLKSFFHRTFRTLKDSSVPDLVIDIRANGGGDIGNSVALTKYIRHTSFRVVDSASAATKHLSPYGSFIKEKFFNSLGLFFLTKKKRDGRYHFTYWEHHKFKPKRLNYNGNIYVLINGFTFSASTLFCNLIKGQENVKLVGEEAGGGWYGNSGIFIPDIVLPNTKLRVRLPLFRIVQYNHIAEKGSGVPPDIYVGPTVKRVRENGDPKMEEVRRMIESAVTKAK